MKKIISMTLAVLMLVTLALAVTSCGMESMTGFTRLRDHVIDKVGKGQTIAMDGTVLGLSSAKITVPVPEGEDTADEVHVIAEGGSQISTVRLTLELNGSPEKARITYEVITVASGEITVTANATILLTHYTGNDPVEFTSMQNIHPASEMNYRESVTSMLNALLMTLDAYTTKELDMNMTELGFVVLSEKYMSSVDEAVTEEDYGGAFSPERLSLAGLMIIQGVGMVFLVLAVLWLVLLLFKKIFYKDPAKAEKKPEEPSPASAPAPAPADDAQLVAAITAAVAAYIESDPALTSQFAGGFRVVSFKKKNGKASWNH